MKRFNYYWLWSLCLLLCSQAGVAAQASWHGWQAIGKANWLVDEQTLSATEGDGFWISPQSYRAFRLTIAFKPSATVNSGVLFGCQPSLDKINPVACYEANIWDEHPKPIWRTGALVTKMSPKVTVDTINQWNEMVVVANDSTVTITINKQLVVEYQITTPLPTGYIALQRFGEGVVQFKPPIIESLQSF